MYVPVYVRVCVYVGTYVRTCMHGCMCVRAHTHVCVCVCVCVCVVAREISNDFSLFLSKFCICAYIVSILHSLFV